MTESKELVTLISKKLEAENKKASGRKQKTPVTGRKRSGAESKKNIDRKFKKS